MTSLKTSLIHEKEIRKRKKRKACLTAPIRLWYGSVTYVPFNEMFYVYVHFIRVYVYVLHIYMDTVM